MAFAESRLRDDDNTVTRTPDLVRWGAVVAAAIIGLAFFALLNTLWFAVAYSAGGGWVGGNLGWFVGATAAAALLVTGCVAGVLAGVRGTLAGLVNGIATWALLFVLSITAVIPGAVSITRMISEGARQGAAVAGGAPATVVLTTESALWTGFWSLLVGLVLAGAGGIIGGRIRRPVVSATQSARPDAAGSREPDTRRASADDEPGADALETVRGPRR
jgi:hypothetical protein